MPQDTHKKTACPAEDTSETKLNTLLGIIDRIKRKAPKTSWHSIRIQLHRRLPTWAIPELATLKSAYRAYKSDSLSIDQLFESRAYSKTAFTSIVHTLLDSTTVTASAKELALIFSRVFFPDNEDIQLISTRSIRAFVQDQSEEAKVALTEFQRSFIKKVQLCLKHPEELDRIHQWNLDTVFGTEAVQQSAVTAAPKAAAIPPPQQAQIRSGINRSKRKNRCFDG